MNMTRKQLCIRLNIKDLALGQIISLFEIPVRGQGAKPARGKTPGLYALADIERALEEIEKIKKLWKV